MWWDVTLYGHWCVGVLFIGAVGTMMCRGCCAVGAVGALVHWHVVL